MSNQEILNRAVAALNTNLYNEEATVEYSGKLPCLTVMGKRFWCIVKPDLTIGDMTGKIPEKYGHIDKDTRILYVTINATSKMLEIAKLPDINVLDCAGNFNIQYQNRNGYLFLMLANKGEKPIEDPTSKAYPIFLEKGLKVIFYLLLDKKNIKHTYREIMDATGVAIGTVKNIIDGMIHHQFVRVEGKKRFLINTERLMTLWSHNYALNLKPKLMQGRFVFRDEDKHKEWSTMKLPEDMMWGGEPAASLTDGFLTPEEFTIYAGAPAMTLLRTGMILPNDNGYIKVYHKFWKGDDRAFVTPALLTFADLMDTTNGRCIEAAQKIKENELKYLL